VFVVCVCVTDMLFRSKHSTCIPTTTHKPYKYKYIYIIYTPHKHILTNIYSQTHTHITQTYTHHINIYSHTNTHITQTCIDTHHRNIHTTQIYTPH
jgi:hypothetical protein